MPRPRRDGEPTAAPNKRKLSEIFLQKLKPQARSYLVWDLGQRNLAVSVQPTGHRSFKVIYSRSNRPRWYHLGAVGAIGLADARKLASRVMFAVAEGKDPAAERKAERSKGTFEDDVFVGWVQRVCNDSARLEHYSGAIQETGNALKG
jgi:hypothetical protein